MKIFVTDRTGQEHEVEAINRWTVMEIIRDGALPILADCGGSCACATCHVYVDPAWVARFPAPAEAERDTLECGMDVRPNSRLSCQLVMAPELDGLRVTLSEDASA